MSIDSQHTSAYLDALLSAVVDAIIEIDEMGAILRFNLAAEKMFGYATEEILGKNVNLLMAEPYHHEHDGYLRNYRETGEAKIIGIGREGFARHRDGHSFPVDISVGEIRHKAGRTFVGILRDTSSRKEAENKLREQEERLRLIFENTPTAILIADLNGNIQDANDAAQRLLGYAAGELSSLAFYDITHPDDIQKSMMHFEQMAQGELQEYQVRKRYLHKNGSTVQGLLHSGVIHNANGVPHMVVAEIEDRTGRMRAERESQELRERLNHVARVGAMGEMATGIAHELNQPLTAISSYANASQRFMATGKETEAHNALGKIVKQAERGGEIIQRLRNHLRRDESQIETIDCNRLIKEVTQLAEVEIRERDLHLRLDLSPDPAYVRADSIQIQQVILNLIRNAGEAMREVSVGEEITVTCSRNLNQIAIQVSDSGPGISDGLLGKIFEPFYSSKPDGMGMGLALSQTILKAHGGKISCRNNRYGGATFIIDLPAVDLE